MSASSIVSGLPYCLKARTGCIGCCDAQTINFHLTTLNYFRASRSGMNTISFLTLFSGVHNAIKKRLAFKMNTCTAASNAKNPSRETIRDAISSVRARIAVAAEERTSKDLVKTNRQVKLIAVSKTKPVDAVLACREAGQIDFGENYVQELKSKAKALPDDIKWHFIGALQTNKASTLLEVPNLVAVHSVDRKKVARSLQRAAEKLEREQLDVLVQVNVDDEDSKAGCALAEVDGLVDVVQECDRLRFSGLMCIGRVGSVEAFRILREERDRVALRIGVPSHTLELSMGMSADFETAIANGSTAVRVGSLLFGAREYPA